RGVDVVLVPAGGAGVVEDEPAAGDGTDALGGAREVVRGEDVVGVAAAGAVDGRPCDDARHVDRVRGRSQGQVDAPEEPDGTGQEQAPAAAGRPLDEAGSPTAVHDHGVGHRVAPLADVEGVVAGGRVDREGAVEVVE